MPTYTREIDENTLVRLRFFLDSGYTLTENDECASLSREAYHPESWKFYYGGGFDYKGTYEIYVTCLDNFEGRCVPTLDELCKLQEEYDKQWCYRGDGITLGMLEDKGIDLVEGDVIKNMKYVSGQGRRKTITITESNIEEYRGLNHSRLESLKPRSAEVMKNMRLVYHEVYKKYPHTITEKVVKVLCEINFTWHKCLDENDNLVYVCDDSSWDAYTDTLYKEVYVNYMEKTYKEPCVVTKRQAEIARKDGCSVYYCYSRGKKVYYLIHKMFCEQVEREIDRRLRIEREKANARDIPVPRDADVGVYKVGGVEGWRVCELDRYGTPKGLSDEGTIRCTWGTSYM